MNLNIRITWPAWAWVNSTIDIIADLFAELGYDLITDIEYESRIKWWVNYFDININNTGRKFLTKKVDILLAFNTNSLEKQLHSLKLGATIIINKKWLSKIDENQLKKFNILSKEIQDKYDNTYLLWIFSLYLWIDLNILLSKIEKIFAKKWDEIVLNNKKIIKNIFESYKINTQSNIKINKLWKSKKIIYWNKAITYWAIEWWLEFYSAYPMTPASTILTEIIASKKVKYIQNEDEIAAINSALWASYTWARSMTGTSWGWFALMTEALSFSVQAEIPITVILAQRAWPSTWTPTYHEAWDLNFALNPTFWDFNHVVLYPSNLEEAYYFWWLALNIADKYQTQVILLMDKQSCELHWTVENLIVPKIDRWIILDTPPLNYKRYELTDSWISPRVKVWTINWDHIVSSYEHNEYGATSEDLENKKDFTEKRFKKLKNFYKNEWIKWYEVYNPSIKGHTHRSANTENVGVNLSVHPKKIIITTSFISYTAKEFIDNNSDFWLIIIKILKPLDERLKEKLINKKEIIFVESNYSGQLENYITKELWLKYINWLKISNLRKYDLFPFYIEDFEKLK